MMNTNLARTMARYDRWQNQSLIAAADKMTDAERWAQRGAFFGSIAETLNHILWDHRVWLARQRGDDASARALGLRHPYTDTPRDWSEYKKARAALDTDIKAWCDGLTESDLAQEVEWVRGDVPVKTDFWFNLFHMFNHATHHRGQVHAMLTSAGIDPGSTDLPMLPDDI
ncbi:MAG: DinB family protein [Pseudomonadota bacterium]